MGMGRSASQALRTGPSLLYASSMSLGKDPRSGLHRPLASVEGSWGSPRPGPWEHALWPLLPAFSLALYMTSHAFLFGGLTYKSGSWEARVSVPRPLECGAAPVCFLQQPRGDTGASRQLPPRAVSGAAPFHSPLSPGSLAVSSNLPLI